MTVRDQFEGEELYASDYIYDEVVTLALYRKDHEEALKLSEYLLKSEVRLLHIVSPVFRDAVELFRNHPISFTDCTSVALMREIGIERIATFDDDFGRFDDVTVVP